jgi:hypothetical protein
VRRDRRLPAHAQRRRFRGAPIGTGAYTASFKLDVAHTFPNGEGGICAPLKGRIALGAGTRDQLVLAVSGDSCEDGAGPLDAASFTGLAQFTVRHASGSYAEASGSGIASFTEDTAKHHRMTSSAESPAEDPHLSRGRLLLGGYAGALTIPLGACGNSPDGHLPVCGGAAGSCTVTQSPPAVRGVRVRVPSCAWVMLLTMARPRPTPAWSVRMRLELR